MRKAFIDALSQLAAADERVILLTGDLGYMVMEPFRARFPDRFINVGVAEQNMIGVATGLAEAGFLPYTYSIATFASLRPFEFIRNGPVLHHLPVRMVGMGMGFEYGHGGPSHYALEDIGALRTLPGLTIVIPADSPQTTTALRQDRAIFPGRFTTAWGKTIARWCRVSKAVSNSAGCRWCERATISRSSPWVPSPRKPWQPPRNSPHAESRRRSSWYRISIPIRKSDLVEILWRDSGT